MKPDYDSKLIDSFDLIVLGAYFSSTISTSRDLRPAAKGAIDHCSTFLVGFLTNGNEEGDVDVVRQNIINL